MSNYPPTPTFGTSYKPESQMEPPAGSYDHGLRQYSYQYQNASSLYGQGQTNGMPVVPHTNANTHSFGSNAQGVTSPSSGNGGNGVQYAPYGAQIQYSAFNSPVFPPTQFAHGAPSYEARSFNQPPINPNLSSNNNTLFSNPHVAAEVQNTNVGDSDTVPHVMSELEDGELDDGEVEQQISLSKPTTTISTKMSQHKRHEKEAFAERDFSHRATNDRSKTLPGLIHGSFSTPNFQGSTASQPQPYSIQNSFIDHPDYPPISQTAENTAAQYQLSTNPATLGSKKADLHLVDQKMEEAKEALRDLHLQGFDFNRIVNAGLNPDVLRNLYTKIGVTVTASSSKLQEEVVKPQVVPKDIPTESAPGAATVGIDDQHSKSPERDSTGDGLGKDRTSNPNTEEGKINGRPTVAVVRNEEKAVQSQASLARSSKLSSANSLGKAAGIKNSETKILDRKEYIARMLAAKAGKSTGSATTPMSFKTSTITDSGASAQVRPSDSTASSTPADVLQKSNESNNTASETQKEDLDVEAKRKAQTVLARQKIEALKLRESIQQQARSGPSNDAIRHSEQPSAKEAPNIPLESSVPTSRPLPSRQSSYFSPASQKPPFSIPGLFMTSDPPEPVDPPQPLANEVFAVSPQGVGYATFDSSQQGLRPHTPESAQPPPVDTTSRLPEVSIGLNPALPRAIATTTSSNRKRQKASDFIDSPSTRVKRPLGQQEDTSVIIDISDDDISNNTSEDESIVTKPVGSRDLLSRSQDVASGNGQERVVKSLPPHTDFSPRKKAAVMTPPVTQASGQSGDLKGLKSKEMEIEFMNRKIAELEQRIAIKAKQTISRTHSPRTSSRVASSPPEGKALRQIDDPSNVPSRVSDSPNGDGSRVENERPSVALAEGNDFATVEQLNAEQQLEEVETAKAEAERSLAAEISQASAADPSLTWEDRLQTPQAEEQSDLREGEQRLTDEEQKRAQSEEPRRLEEEQSQQLREETKEFRQPEVERHLQEQEQRRAKPVREEHLQEHKRKRSLDNQRQARKSEIESGLPLLDAEVERTRKRLESLRQEMTDLETELQKGIEGRQHLIEELNSLSRSTEALSGPINLDSCDAGDIPKQPSISDIPALTKPATSGETIPNSDPIQFLGAVSNGSVVQAKSSSPQTTDHRMSSEELEEDVMDISRSDVDEAELSLYSPDPLNELQDASGFVDDDENYEPPNEISIVQRKEPNPDAVVLYQDLETAKANVPVATQNQSFADQGAELIRMPTSIEPSPAPNDNIADDEQSQRSPSRSPSLADAGDSDDYEPPEPASLGEEALRPEQMSSAGSEESFSPPDVGIGKSVASVTSVLTPAVQQKVGVEAVAVGAESNGVQKCKTGHYTPYESPLKQFKSFRYHPQYLKEVSSGYRSLTYSHTINPEIPLCRYELDGVCNDDSCQSQHLRNIGMSDDKILVDLGARPDDGSSPDTGEFGNGLRAIIHDIRSRKIRDFNIVAGEITAYRAKFLGDSTKVLPL